ncbi:GNAT family N-acetyltransferase [Microbacterium sp. M28]|uniref:GNAT family N-acetyltransferase n=1 Tax=Microbacterium sp. M28 TaxID=2962064 RepID=UPI0021F485C1|nr:GNAT family N-acetyltransferase [Microbacterium sp. M28]UYO97153.1 GNAT family N-acetyltransferase [Microbacterium sp. M28]
MLERISPEVAARIIARDEKVGDAWHAEYPFEDELVPLRMLAQQPNPHPVFTLYLVRDQDGLAVGGLGFFGPPDETGTVGIGYGLIPAARGRGLASDAVMHAVRIAAEHGARRIIADTDLTNLPSQRVLLKAGFSETHRDAEKAFYELDLRHRSA